MLLSVGKEIADVLVNTVILSHNKLARQTQTQFMRCFNCGAGITQIQGFVGAIYAGFIPSVEVPTITRCHNCHTNFTFQTQDKSSQSWTKLIVPAGDHVLTFHCIVCRNPQFQYTRDGAITVQGATRLDYPTPFGCNNTICQAKYLLRDIVVPENLL